MCEVSRNVKSVKIWNVSVRVAILIYDNEQAMSATLMDFLQVHERMIKAKMVSPTRNSINYSKDTCDSLFTAHCSCYLDHSYIPLSLTS